MFGESFDRVMAMGGFFEDFYENLRSSSKEFAEMAADRDLLLQSEMLAQSLIHLVDYFSYGTPSAEFTRIAAFCSKKQLDIEPRCMMIGCDPCL